MIHDPGKNLKHHVGPDKRIAAAETPWRLYFYPLPPEQCPSKGTGFTFVGHILRSSGKTIALSNKFPIPLKL
jgi:hypothetical protein